MSIQTKNYQFTVTREAQESDTLYVLPDDTTFYSPDGEGRIYSDTLAEAQENHGDDLPVVYLDVAPQD